MIYEILAIIPSKYSDTEVDGAIEAVTKTLEAAGAKTQKTQNMGKLKIAYPIKGVRFGTYVLFYVEAETEAMKKVEQNLKLAEEVLRHIIIARPEGIPTFTFKMSAYQPPLTAEGRRAGEREERAPRQERAEGAEKPRLSTEELNDKLDQILDSDIMKNI